MPGLGEFMYGKQWVRGVMNWIKNRKSYSRKYVCILLSVKKDFLH